GVYRTGDAEAGLAEGKITGLDKTMQHPAHLRRAILTNDGERVRRGRAGMDDQTSTAFARRPDMSAKARALPGQIAGQPVIVESGLADRDDLGSRGERNKLGDRWLRRVFDVGMYADRGEEIGVVCSKLEHRRQLRQVDADA